MLPPDPPPRFADAVDATRSMIAACEAEGIPADSILAAMMVELLPRMVAAYGQQGVVGILHRFAAEIADTRH